MSSSIAEIGRRLNQTTEVVRVAVDEAQVTNQDIGALAQGARKIGDVTKLIRNIAGQTNLLALNATIEAARRRSRARLRGGCCRGEVACRADREGDLGYFQPEHGSAEPDR
ncbi:MAG TPA: methyl-accepting chemotaxis protein [Pseudolabrys sp.]|nr:methyl-accepting chemotaxis protein [Pseudolabrys sp.]